MTETFLWHDYETFGADPARDRPAQFAALRTTPDLTEIDQPQSFYCQPANDFLPHPIACLITGITPQHAQQHGLNEADFAKQIFLEMAEPNTCSVGYNNLRFDDEVSRNLFYRNFYDPYAREWRNGNSRFDLIDLTRMCYALRPQGLEWPTHPDGKPSFKLEHLTAANDIHHSGAHDALADVRATIDWAKRIKTEHPRLYTYALQLRNQRQAQQLLNPLKARPILHTSAKFSAERGCTTMVLPLAVMPGRPKSFITVDLMSDPQALLELSIDAISDRLFTPTTDLPEGVERIPLKTVHSNKVPMLAPLGVLKGVDQERIGLNQARCEAHANQLLQHAAEIRHKVEAVFSQSSYPDNPDPDTALYSGGFFSQRDRRWMERVQRTPHDQLDQLPADFDDSRLAEMLFRYRARNFPTSLDNQEMTRWDAFRSKRLLQPDDERILTYSAFQELLLNARVEHSKEPKSQQILDQLEAWVLNLGIHALQK